MHLAVLYILPEAVPAFLAWPAALAAAAAWWGAQRARQPGRTGKAFWVGFAGRSLIGFATLLLFAQALAGAITVAAQWPPWLVALLGAAAVEGIVALYDTERQGLDERVAHVLVALRIALVVLLALMLLQPELHLRLTEQHRRTVAVLVDDSASMRIADTRLSPARKVRLAQVLLADAPARPFRLEQTALALRDAAGRLALRAQWLGMVSELPPQAAGERVAGEAGELRNDLAEVQDAVAAQVKELEEPLRQLGDGTRTAELKTAREALAGPVAGRLAQAVQTAADPEKLVAQLGPLLQLLQQTREDVLGAARGVNDAADALDAALYESLDEQARARVDRVASLTRLEIATRLLLTPAGDAAKALTDYPPGSLLDRLGADYRLRIYRFASRARPVERLAAPGEPAADDGPEPVDDDKPEAAPRIPDEETNMTSLASALRQATLDTPAELLAGIVLLTDGRDNAPESVEPVAQRLGLQEVPVVGIVMGGEKPPTDAAIVSLSAPETVYRGDKIIIGTDLKFDGMAGREARLDLYSADTVVASQSIEIATDQVRTRRELVDTAADTGMTTYRVALSVFDDEVIRDNNEYAVTISVTDERTQLLVLDGRPRWEFRYLKNLFISRDKTVKLQWLVFQPETIAGQGPRPVIPAAAGKPLEETEATALPQDQSQWLRFDVVILGDVSPQWLPPPAQEALRKFVTDRGGTLIVVAGPQFMPGSYLGLPLAEILPVQFEKSAAPFVRQQEESFRLALTPQGRESLIMRQEVDPKANEQFWEGVPPMFWRHPVVGTKPGATALAYARPMPPPEFLVEGEDEAPAAELVARRNEFMRSHVLVAQHRVALGQVIMLTFDRTWRLRFRAGDEHHHKLWGQLLRSATISRMPSGTGLARLGTDRSRYALHSRITARAKIIQPDLKPLVSEEVAVSVYRGEHRIMRRKMEYVADSPGLYEAQLGKLPSGSYRVALESPALEEILQETAEPIVSEFSVDPAGSAEQAELAADAGTVGRLANVTGGALLEPSQIARAPHHLGANMLRLVKERQFTVWDSWPLLLAMVIIATCEWLIRKKVGLP
jgi:hypothetical protein